MRWRAGFTLIEASLALGIAAGMFTLTSGVDRVLLRPLRQDPVAWYQMVRVLEQPGRYRIIDVDGQQLNLQDQQKQVTRAVWVDSKHVLRLTNTEHQGYYPLLRRVEAVHWHLTKYPGLVRLNLKQERLPWQTTILDLRGGDS